MSRSDAAGYGLLAIPAGAYLAVVFVVPLAMLVAGSILVEGSPTLRAYSDYLADAHHRATVWTTIRYALLSSLACLVLGYPFARLMAQATGAAQALLFAVVLLPMSLSLMVRAFGWTLLLGREGPLNQALLALGVVDSPVRLLFTEFGLVLGTVSIKLPLMILPIYVVLRTIPPELAQAGASLGAGPLYRFRRLDLPLAMPGMLAGFALVFSQCAAAYVLPTLLGGARYQILSKSIVDAYLILQAGAMGSVISVLLLAIVVAALAATGLAGRRRAWA